MQSAVAIQKRSNPKGPSTGSFFGKGNRSAINQLKKENTSTSFFNIDSSTHTGIQTKLSVGKPGDKYEVEADAMADKVVSRLAHDHGNDTPFFSTIKPTLSIQPKCTECAEEEVQKKEEEIQEEETIQAKSLATDTDALEDEVQLKYGECKKSIQTKGEETNRQPNIESQLNSSKSSGSPMAKNTKESMEAGMGADFSKVNIHTGSQAVQMSEQLNAQAFTHGNDIYFNQGKFDVQSNKGQHLLAHELTHVVQQSSSSSSFGTKKNELQRAPSCKDTDTDTPETPEIFDFTLDPELDTIRNSVFTNNDFVLRFGSTGPAVQLIQEFLLNVACTASFRTDLKTEFDENIFEANTKQAVIAFQASKLDVNGNKLKENGTIDAHTLGAMDLLLGAIPTAPAKPPEGKGRCFGVAEEGPGEHKELNIKGGDLLMAAPFFPAQEAWELSNFDIAEFFLKTEHRSFLRSTIIPSIKAALKGITDPKGVVRVIGEASTTGSNNFNLKLSGNRADCVRDTLIELGLDKNLIQNPLSAFGEELVNVRRILGGAPPIDGIEDRSARKVTLVMDVTKTADEECDKSRPSHEFVAKIACESLNSYRINIGDISTPTDPTFREFRWVHFPLADSCKFSLGLGPNVFLGIKVSDDLQLSSQNPDDASSNSDFQGLLAHVSTGSRNALIKETAKGVGSPFAIPFLGGWNSESCAKDNSKTLGTMMPIGPVKCGMVPSPPESTDCNKTKEESCPDEVRQAAAQKFIAYMIRGTTDPLEILKRYKLFDLVKDVMDLFGLKPSVTGAGIVIGSVDLKDNPISRGFGFAGASISDSSKSSTEANVLVSEVFTLENPKQLETSASGLLVKGSDFNGRASLTVKGGTNKEELNISAIGKTIIFRGPLCDTGGDRTSHGFMKAGPQAQCGQLGVIPAPDKKCDDTEDCPDSQKLQDSRSFIIKVGRASISSLPLVGKRLADSMGCEVSAAFINIGTDTEDDGKKIFRKFLFIGKNSICGYDVGKDLIKKSFFLPRQLAYQDPNDRFSFSDFAGKAVLDGTRKLSVTPIPYSFKLPGSFDGICLGAEVNGVMIPLNAVDCGDVPDPLHSTVKDTSDLDRCKTFKKANSSFILTERLKLLGEYLPIVNAVKSPPKLRYSEFKKLKHLIGTTIKNAVFVGKASDGQPIITIVDMRVERVIPHPRGFAFVVTFTSDPCTYNLFGKTMFVSAKDCIEGYLSTGKEFVIEPIFESDTVDDKTKKEPAESVIV